MERICFVVCPIGEPESQTRKDSDQLFEHILMPACVECGFNCVRADKINSNDMITDTVLQYLDEADLVIADLSGHNPNAFFELGYRSALKKPVIQMKQFTDKIPFDVAFVRTIDYDLHDLDKAKEATNRLIETIKNLKFDTHNESSEDVLNYNSLLMEIFKIHDELNNMKRMMSQINHQTKTRRLAVRDLSDTHRTSEEPAIVSLFDVLDFSDNNAD